MVSIGCNVKSPTAVAKAPHRHKSNAFNDFLAIALADANIAASPLSLLTFDFLIDSLKYLLDTEPVLLNFTDELKLHEQISKNT